MGKRISLIITLAIIFAGVIYFYLDKYPKTQLPIISENKYSKEESLELVVQDILKELEKSEKIKFLQKDNQILIQPDVSDIENLINNNKIAKEKKIISVRTNDFILFKRDNETLSVKLIISKEPTISRPKLAIIIDDIGNSKELGEELFKFKGLTYSILPDLPYSKYFAELGKKEGKEIMLHVPMEPKDNNKYGENDNLLKVSMTSKEIKEKIEKLIKSLDGIRGVNNHMGSKFTEDEEKVRVFLSEIKKRNIFFLDSRTSPDSKAYDIAKEMGIKSYKRDFFLDHNIDEVQIKEQLEKAVNFALQNGYAIAIGHPHKETIKVLKEKLPEISKTVDVVPLSKIGKY